MHYEVCGEHCDITRPVTFSPYCKECRDYMKNTKDSNADVMKNINDHNAKYDEKEHQDYMDTIPTLNLFRERMLKVSTKNLHLVRDLLAQQPEILDDLRGVAADIILTRENTTTGDKVDLRISQAKSSLGWLRAKAASALAKKEKN